MKSHKTILIFIWVAFAAATAQAQSSGWRGIEPGVSTRNQVDRILGKPEHCRAPICYYDHTPEDVEIRYSRGPCPEDERSPFDFPADTVLDISVNLKPVPLSQSQFDLTKFVVSEDAKLPG